MTRASRRPLFAALLLALVPACLAGPAVAADPPVEFVNTGTDCRNLLVSGDLDPVVARELVPQRFDIGAEPTGFVELASCAGGELDGKPLGAFRIAEAAIDILPPAPVPGSSGTALGGDIYALTQLDSNTALSQRKRAVGFTSEIVDIELTPSGPFATRLDASIPWVTSPYRMGADVTPAGAPIPAATIVTKIWGLGPKGVVVTHNDIQTIKSGSAGMGTATFKEGTVLARLFGTTRLFGQSISGIGDFVNTTYVIEPAPAAAPVPAPATVVARVTRGRRLVVKGPGKLVVTIRRGARPDGRLARTLRGSRRVAWNGRDRSGRRVRRGTYTVRVRRASDRRTLRTFTLVIGTAGPTRVR